MHQAPTLPIIYIFLKSLWNHAIFFRDAKNEIALASEQIYSINWLFYIKKADTSISFVRLVIPVSVVPLAYNWLNGTKKTIKVSKVLKHAFAYWLVVTAHKRERKLYIYFTIFSLEQCKNNIELLQAPDNNRSYNPSIHNLRCICYISGLPSYFR